jgi:hypothetical protein
MKRPRDRMHRGVLCAAVDPMDMFFRLPIATRITGQPREWRRAAAWLRQVADWWDCLADEQEMKQSRPIRRRLFVCERQEDR